MFVRTAFHLSIGTMWGEDLFWKKKFSFFVVFGHWAIVLLLFINAFTRGCQNGVVRAQKIFLVKLVSLEEYFLFIILHIDWKIFGFLAEFARDGCRNWCLNVYWKPVERCFGKNNIKSSSILDILRKTFGFLSKSSRHCCPTAYYWSIEHSEWIDFPLKRMIFAE